MECCFKVWLPVIAERWWDLWGWNSLASGLLSRVQILVPPLSSSGPPVRQMFPPWYKPLHHRLKQQAPPATDWELGNHELNHSFLLFRLISLVVLWTADEQTHTGAPWPVLMGWEKKSSTLGLLPLRHWYLGRVCSQDLTMSPKELTSW